MRISRHLFAMVVGAVFLLLMTGLAVLIAILADVDISPGSTFRKGVEGATWALGFGSLTMASYVIGRTIVGEIE